MKLALGSDEKTAVTDAVRDDLERGTACDCAKTAATCRALVTVHGSNSPVF